MEKTNRLTKEEGLRLLKKADLLDLGRMAGGISKSLHPEGIVTFIIDRNINYTNICINKCRFCAFWRDEGDPEAYLLEKDELFRK
ncbi:MAG: dehypoxanthine futalosine cyclase, partial [Nitrospirota bacterium]